MRGGVREGAQAVRREIMEVTKPSRVFEVKSVGNVLSTVAIVKYHFQLSSTFSAALHTSKSGRASRLLECEFAVIWRDCVPEVRGDLLEPSDDDLQQQAGWSRRA